MVGPEASCRQGVNHVMPLTYAGTAGFIADVLGNSLRVS